MKFTPSLALLSILLLLISTSCKNEAGGSKNAKEKGEVNIYSHRHYDTDKALYKEFEQQTGIKVNVVDAKAEELINRLATEGENTPADILITADAGHLYLAKNKGLLQNIISETLNAHVPSNYRDPEGEWFGLTKRARVVVYAKDRVKAEELSTYEDLAAAKWKGRILVRSSDNIYNQSLMAALIAHRGSEEAEAWAKSVVANFAREPKGNDRDQVKDIAQGKGDIAIINTYYLAKLLQSENGEERKAGENVGIAFPVFEGHGVHVNISGAGVTRHAKNKAQAIQLLEFLTDTKAQAAFAEANYEYPVNPAVQATELLRNWGTFKEDDLNLSKLGENNAEAVKIFDRANWK